MCDVPEALHKIPPMPVCKSCVKPTTFASQEEFENAVMAVVMKRLNVFFADNSDPWGGRRTYCNLEDK